MAKARCPFCSHEQKTKSKSLKITCSSCQKKFPNPFSNKEIKKKPTTPINNREIETNIGKIPEENIKENKEEKVDLF